MPDDLDRGAPQHVVFLIRQGLRGSDDDGITRVRSKRIEVLHVTANDSVLMERDMSEDRAMWTLHYEPSHLHRQRLERLRIRPPSNPSNSFQPRSEDSD
jgi:hypothetical protein